MSPGIGLRHRPNAQILEQKRKEAKEAKAPNSVDEIQVDEIQAKKSITIAEKQPTTEAWHLNQENQETPQAESQGVKTSEVQTSETQLKTFWMGVLKILKMPFRKPVQKTS